MGTHSRWRKKSMGVDLMKLAERMPRVYYFNNQNLWMFVCITLFGLLHVCICVISLVWCLQCCYSYSVENYNMNQEKLLNEKLCPHFWLVLHVHFLYSLISFHSFIYSLEFNEYTVHLESIHLLFFLHLINVSLIFQFFLF